MRLVVTARQRYENEPDSLRVWIESQFVIKVFRFDSQHCWGESVIMRTAVQWLPQEVWASDLLYFRHEFYERGKKNGSHNWKIQFQPMSDADKYECREQLWRPKLITLV